jgi:hypothetical protein
MEFSRMARPRILVAGGCSFSQVPNNYTNWPVFLRDKLQMQAYFTGAGSACNDLICKRVIHRVTECLTLHKYKPQNILVGVMWTGVNRDGFYLSKEPVDYTKIETGNMGWYSNPNAVSSQFEYYLTNPNWNDGFSNLYYKHLYDDVGNLIKTLEQVLRLQWFLKLNNVRYFFTNYERDSFTGGHYDQYLDHLEVSYLYNQIDFDNFLPVKSMGDWNINESGFEFEIKNDDHPTTQMSKGFVDRVIIPHLEKRGYI